MVFKSSRRARRPSRHLLLESLESRIVLSAGVGLPLTHAGHGAGGNISISTAAAAAGRAPALAVGNDTVIAPGSYSSIFHSQLESRINGHDIGYVSRSGAYVEYTLNVATAGAYTLNVSVAAATDASFTISDNGNTLASFSTPGTGGWDAIASLSQSVTLPAGTQTLRFTATRHTQYNLNGFELTLQPPLTPVSPPPATTTTDPVTTPTTTTPPATTTATTTATTATTDSTTTTTTSGTGMVSSSSSSQIFPTAVVLNSRVMTSFTELDISAIASDTNILVSQSGNTFTVIANGVAQQITGNFGDLMVYGAGGTSTITVDSSVTLPATVYAGSGNDTITNATKAQATIVTLDGGVDTVTGNGVNTAFWVDPSDTVNATAAETANGGVHVVSSATIYQPYTTTPGATGYVTATRDGSNLVDPSATTSTTTRLTSSSFWGTGPVMQDINQGQSSDCYYLTVLQSLAQFEPGKLQQLGVDLGDGTYLVQFDRGGKIQDVRVDGDLPSGGPYANGLLYEHPGASGDQWACIFEKAYAYFRTGANSYASLDNGFTTTVYNDFGIADSLYVLPSSQASFYATVSAKLAADKPVEVLTNNGIVGGAPLVASHTYTVLSVSQDASGTVWLTIRNPWGFDGFNVDSNPSDGILTINYSTLLANALYGSVAT